MTARGAAAAPAPAAAVAWASVALAPAALVVVVLAAGWGQATASGWRVWLVGGALAVVVAWARSRDPAEVGAQAQGGWVGWAWWTVGGWAALSALWSPYPGAALWVGAWLLGLASAQRLGEGLRARGGLEALQVAAVVGGVIASAPALVPGGPVEGTFGNPDHLAGFLSLTLLWTLLPTRARAQADSAQAAPSAQRARGGWVWARVGRGVAAAAQVAALWALNSLGAWAAVGAGLTATATARLVRAGRAWWGAAVAVGSLAALVAAPALSAEVAAHIRGRWFMARVTWEVVTAHAVAGVGAGQLPAAWSEAQRAWFADPTHATQRDLWTQAHHAHNEWLHLAAELGVVAALCWSLPLAAALWRGSRHPAPWASVVAACMLGLVTMPLYEPATALLLTLCVGALYGPRRAGAEVGAEVGADAGAQARARLLAWGRAAVAVAGLGVLSAQALGERLLVLGEAKGQAQGEPALAWSVAVSPRPAASLRLLADALGPSDPAAAWALAADAAAREPSPRAWAFAGQWAMRAGQTAAACDAFQRAVDLHPWFFTGHFNLALCAHALGDPARALRHAARARSLRPSDARLPRLPAPPPASAPDP